MTTVKIFINAAHTENALTPILSIAGSAVTADIINAPAVAEALRLAISSGGTTNAYNAYECDCGTWRVNIPSDALQGITDANFAVWCEDATNRSYCLGIGQLLIREGAQ